MYKVHGAYSAYLETIMKRIQNLTLHSGCEQSKVCYYYQNIANFSKKKSVAVHCNLT